MHEDVPGIIGNVGTAFGGTGVNIAQMTVGRAAPGGDAIGVSKSRSGAIGRFAVKSTYL